MSADKVIRRVIKYIESKNNINFEVLRNEFLRSRNKCNYELDKDKSEIVNILRRMINQPDGLSAIEDITDSSNNIKNLSEMIIDSRKITK